MSGDLKVDIDKKWVLLYELEPGDPVMIMWADASLNLNVRKLSNVVVACHKRWSGRFVTLRHEKAYGTEYIILESMEKSWHDGRLQRAILCIPVVCIVNVKRIKGKPQKFTSEVGEIYLGGGRLRTIEQLGGIGEIAGRATLGETAPG